MSVEIMILRDAIPGWAEENCRKLTGLVRYISPSSPAVDPPQIRIFFRHGGSLILAMAPHDGIVGMATLVPMWKINDRTASLEHFVVQPGQEGKGIGKLLAEAVVKEGRGWGVRYIDLTCAPLRVAANHIYEAAGFKLRLTNARRLSFSS